MNWSRAKATDDPQLSFQRWLQIHDEKEKRGTTMKMQSRKVRDFADVGRNFRYHMAVGDPMADYVKDKHLHSEMRRLQSVFGDPAPSGSRTPGQESDQGIDYGSSLRFDGFGSPASHRGSSRPSEATSREATSRESTSRGAFSPGIGRARGEPRPPAPPLPGLPLPLRPRDGAAATPPAPAGGLQPGLAAPSRSASASALPGTPAAKGALAGSRSAGLLRPRPTVLSPQFAERPGGGAMERSPAAASSVPWPTSASSYMGCRRGTTLTLG